MHSIWIIMRDNDYGEPGGSPTGFGYTTIDAAVERVATLNALTLNTKNPDYKPYYYNDITILDKA